MQIVSKVIYSLLFHENDLEEGYMFKKIYKRRRKKKETKTQLKCLLELKIVLTKK